MRALDGRSASGLKELAALLYGSSARWQQRGFAVLQAYFDDSASHSDSKIFVVAGVFGAAHHWEEFVPRWEAILKKYKLP
ncbi:MAG: hypothetical protein ACREPP_02235, partial [Rhodanobacteraceae bacterium]